MGGLDSDEMYTHFNRLVLLHEMAAQNLHQICIRCPPLGPGCVLPSQIDGEA